MKAIDGKIIDDNGMPVRFEAQRVPGKGWTVVKVTGSRRLGRSVERADGFDGVDYYTMHQAQMAAENMQRDVYRSIARQQ